MRKTRFSLLAALILPACVMAALVLPTNLTAHAQPASGPSNPTAREVLVLRNLEYSRPAGRSLALDLYRPKNAEGPLPLIVWVHGGAWRTGSKNQCPAAWMVQYGYAVASLDYRLSQEAPFPAQIVDCKAAIRWLRAHAAEYGIDPTRIGAWGSSAGGHLAALLGTAGDVPLLEGSENEGYSSRVQAVCDYFGPTHLVLDDLSAGMGRNGLQAVSQLLGTTDDNELAALASPTTFVSPDDPPFLIVHGTEDQVVPLAQSRLLFETLQKAGVEATLHIVQGAGHGFKNYNLSDLVLKFFDKHLKKTNPPDRP